MSDFTASILIGLAAFCAYILYRISDVVISIHNMMTRIEADISAIKRE